MFVGAYWSQREESKEAAAARIAEFLTAIGARFEELSTWFSKGWTRAAALRAPLVLDSAAVASKLRVNRREDDRQPIPELGFGLSVWNGKNASLSAHVGSYSPYVGNSIVLDLGEPVALSSDSFRVLLEELIRAFDPDHAVVTSDEHLARTGAMNPWDAGWFTYARGGEVREHEHP